MFKIARAISKPEKSAVQSVLDEFFTLTPDGYRHKRCDEEIERYQISQEGADAKRENDKLRQERARERRKALFEQLRSHGVVAPWDAKTHELEAHLSRVTSTHQSQPVTRDEHEPVTRDNTANQTPIPRHQTPNTNNTPKPPPSTPDGFDSFWSAYPKKVGKPAALKAFRAAKLNGHLPEVLADIDGKSRSESWSKNGGQFIPNPATYLNQRRWEDMAPDPSKAPALDPNSRGAIEAAGIALGLDPWDQIEQWDTYRNRVRGLQNAAKNG